MQTKQEKIINRLVKYSEPTNANYLETVCHQMQSLQVYKSCSSRKGNKMEFTTCCTKILQLSLSKHFQSPDCKINQAPASV